MRAKKNCDIAIIGAGSAGLSLAAGAVQLGLKVILLERGKMGGDCLNYGCVPSKSLLSAAKRIWQARHSEFMGLRMEKSEVDFDAVMQHVHGVIASIAPHDSIERFEKLGVRVIKGSARFVDASTIMVNDEPITAKRFVIAAGSSPAVPPIPGLDKVDYLTNETLFDLRKLPKHLLVIGGGPIGCEMAQAFAMLGSQVTLLEGMRILNQDDEDCAAVVRKSLLDCGVKIVEGMQIKEVLQDSETIQVLGENGSDASSFSGSHLLVATGRTPNIKDLACEKAGIATERNGIIVDNRLRTSNKRVFAIGDSIGQLQFTHVANAHAGIVLRNIAFKLPAKMKTNAIPWVTYTDPELAHIGKTWKQAVEGNLNPVIYRFSYNENDRALAEAKSEGFIKLMTTKKGKVLGVSIVGDRAGELLPPWEILLREGTSLRSLTDSIVAYPTLAEINKRVASQFYIPTLFSPGTRRLVRFLNNFNW